MRLEAHALAFGYRKHPVGRDVSLALAAGEIMCLLGPNGGGKTTLFRTLLGLLPAQGGRVTLDGADLRALPRREVAKRIAYVPQAHIGYFPFTVRDVVLMGRTAHLAAFAGPSRRDRELAEEALARFGLSRLADADLHSDLGGRAAADADCPSARAGGAAAGDGRTDGEPRLREPGARARPGDRAGAIRDRGAALDPRSGPGVPVRRPGGACAGETIAQGAPEAVLTREHLRELYGVEVEVTEVSLAGGARRRVCADRGWPMSLRRRAADLTGIRALLEASGLPGADLTPAHLGTFWIRWDAAGIAGVVGLEPHGRAALVRSLAVRADGRGQGLGAALLAHAESQAGALGVETLYLLTTTTRRSSPAHGYAVTPRQARPRKSRLTAEFAELFRRTRSA